MSLDGLEGIRGGSVVQGSDRSVLERLIEVEVGAIIDQTYRDLHWTNMFQAYDHLYDIVATSLDNVDFDEKDLEQFVRINMDSDSERNLETHKGRFTAVLLDLLIERNREKGKETKIHINGEGGRFNYLFYQAKKVDQLIVENVSGDHICQHLGADGNANLVVLINNNSENLACSAGSLGAVNTLLAIDNSAGELGGDIAREGKLNLAVCVGNTAGSIARNAGAKHGRINMMLVADNVSGCILENHPFGSVVYKVEGNRSYSKVSEVRNLSADMRFGFVQNCKGLRSLCAGYQSEARILVIDGCLGLQYRSSLENQYRFVSKLVLHQGEDSLSREGPVVYRGDRVSQEYLAVVGQYKADKILALARTIKKGQDSETIFNVAKRIQAVYDSVKGKFEDGIK